MRLCVKVLCVKKLYERYDANYCLVFVMYCLDTTLLVCLLYIFNILSSSIMFPYLHQKLCSSTLSGQPSSSFQWFVAPEGRKVGSLKQRARSHLARWEMNSCTPLWPETHFQKNVQSTPHSDHFWKLTCRKIARRCGPKHISKSKCTNHLSFGALLEVEMSKKCTPLWREAHFQIKTYKTHQPWNTFGRWHVPKLHGVVAPSTFRSQNVKNSTVEMSKKCTPLWREAQSQIKSVKLTGFRSTFWRSDVVLRGRRKGFGIFSKVSKTWGFCISKKRWQAWDIWRGSAKMHFAWPVQYKRHVHQR